MKNKNGFASSILIYSMFLFFLVIISLNIIVIVNSKLNTTLSTDEIKEQVNKIVPYNVELQ